MISEAYSNLKASCDDVMQGDGVVLGPELACKASAKTPALLLSTSIFGCAFLTSSANCLTCDMEERSAAKA